MIDYEQLLNPEVVHIQPSGIRKFFDIAEQMDDVISLGVGEPDFPTPWHIRRAGIRSLEQSRTRYTSNWGQRSLRVALHDFVERKYGLSYDPDSEILVTVGGSEAIDGCIRSVVRPGDEVIIPQPSFVCYEPLTRMAGGVPVIVETRAEDAFRLTPEALRAALTPRTRLLILPFPCNPTGAVMRKADLEAIADVLRETNVAVLSDEIYAELTYGGERHVSIASIDGMRERTVVINGFSKTFSMTGWRMGYACGPAPILRQMVKIHQFAIMCAPTTSQYAAEEALKNGDADVADMLEKYDIRRRLVVNGFRRLGLDCHEPEGSFYVFPSIRSTGLTSDAFCEELLYSKRVALVPGTAFGRGGEGFVRVSYCYSVDHLNAALARLEEFLAERKG